MSDKIYTVNRETPNQRYERKLKQAGLKKITMFVPEWCAQEFVMMAERCREDRNLKPHLMRNEKTGKWASIEKATKSKK